MWLPLPTVKVRDGLDFCPLTGLVRGEKGDWFSCPDFSKKGEGPGGIAGALVPLGNVLMLQLERVLSGLFRGSVREVAEALGVPYRTLHECRRGKRNVSLERVQAAINYWETTGRNLHVPSHVGPLPSFQVVGGFLYLRF